MRPVKQKEVHEGNFPISTARGAERLDALLFYESFAGGAFLPSVFGWSARPKLSRAPSPRRGRDWADPVRAAREG